MNPVVEKFMEDVKGCGYTPEEIRAKVREAAEITIESLFERSYWTMREAMGKMSFDDLRDILEETKEGGES